MCFNCGCDIPDDNMGKDDVKGASLTNLSFQEMADEWKMPKEEAMENTYKLLKKVLKKD